MLTGSAVTKFMITPESAAKMPDIGWQPKQMFALGIIELASTLLFIIPTRLSFIGLVLLTGYMGGAIAAHVRIGEAPIPQVVIAVLLWIGYCMSRPDVFNAAFGIASKQRDNLGGILVELSRFRGKTRRSQSGRVLYPDVNADFLLDGLSGFRSDYAPSRSILKSILGASHDRFACCPACCHCMPLVSLHSRIACDALVGLAIHPVSQLDSSDIG